MALHDVLHEAAAAVTPPADGLERAVRRGRRLRRRSAAARAGVVPLAIVLAVFAFDSSRGPQRVDVVDDGRTTTTGGSQPAPSGPMMSRPGAGGTNPATSSSLVPGVLPASRATTTTTFVAPPTGPSTRIAFVGPNGGIYTMRLDGSDDLLLQSAPMRPVAWSPDHRMMLVLPNWSTTLEALDVETGQLRRLFDGDEVFGADISPDGSQIVLWTSDEGFLPFDGPPDRLWVMDADGSGLHELPTSGREPSWSPDGSRILFTACAENQGEACTIRPDGTDVAPLPLPSLRSLRWSPDGRWLAGLDGTSDLVVVRPDGTGKRRVADDLASAPAWTPDSKAIVYGRTGSSGIAKVAVDGGAPVPLTYRDRSSPVIPWR